MYENFNIGDTVYLIALNKMKKKYYSNVIEAKVITKSTSLCVELSKSVYGYSSLIFENGHSDVYFTGGEFSLYSDKVIAETTLKNLQLLYKKENISQEIHYMIDKADMKQLEAVYSYFLAENERKERCE